MKNLIIVVAFILTITCSFVLYNASESVSKIEQSLNNERFLRMESEEKLQKISIEMKALQYSAEEANKKLAKARSALKQSNEANEAVKQELDAQIKENRILKRRVEREDSKKAPGAWGNTGKGP